MIENFINLTRDFYERNGKSLSNLDGVGFIESITTIPRPLIGDQIKKNQKHFKAIISPVTNIIDSQILFETLYSTKDYAFWLDSAKVYFF